MLRSDDHGRVRVLTFDRPDALNAFNQALYQEAADALVAAAADDGVAVVVLTGEGRAFSAGQDLFEMADLGRTRVDSEEPRVNSFSAFIDALSGCLKPVIAAVNGLGVGVGFTLLAHCDLVLISRTARLRTPFTALGVAPEAASSYLFPTRMGWQRAAWVLFSSEWVSAEEAVDLGMAWKVCEPDAVLDDALAAAQTLAKMPIVSLVATKRLMLDSHLAAIGRSRDLENAAFAQLLGGPASREALQAFAEHREPDFTDLPAG